MNDLLKHARVLVLSAGVLPVTETVELPSDLTICGTAENKSARPRS